MVLSVFLIAAGLLAEDVPSSITYSASQGVFSTELDAASSVREPISGPGFGELDASYLFGGLGNINQGRNTQTIIANTGSPLWLGYYHAGDMPWSLFVGLSKEDIEDSPQDAKTITNTANKVVTLTAPDTKTVTWVTQETETEYTHKPFAQEINDTIRFITSLGDINLGAFIALKITENLTTTGPPPATELLNNYKQTDTYYYDANAANAANVANTATSAMSASPCLLLAIEIAAK